MINEVVKQPSIVLSGIRIDEPVVMLTDLLISTVAFYAYFQLKKFGNSNLVIQNFRRYFLFLGWATFFGGVIGHGFLYLFDYKWKLLGWSIGIISVTFIERASIFHVSDLISKRLANCLMYLNIIGMLLALVLIFTTFQFKWVEIHSAYGLVVNVVGFHLFAYLKKNDLGSFLVLSSVAISGVAAIVFINRISPHTWFNHIDVSHVILAVGAYIMYKGVLKLQK